MLRRMFFRWIGYSPPKATIPYALRRAVFRRDGRQCRYCGITFPPFHLDHVVPESKGGKTTHNNLVVACASCNLRKGTDTWEPYPVGYFQPQRRRSRSIWLSVLALFLAALWCGMLLQAGELIGIHRQSWPPAAIAAITILLFFEFKMLFGLARRVVHKIRQS